jgi:hypothetical protein
VDGFWWIAFGHYAGRGGGYVCLSQVVERLHGMSNSGGVWGEDGRLYATGHDDRVTFVLSRSTAGPVFYLQATLPLTAERFGFSWNATQPGAVYSILRSSREVVVSKRQ